MENNILQHQRPVSGSSFWLSGTDQLLVFNPAATKKLFQEVGWLRYDYPDNQKELGGILIGYYICDGAGNHVQAEVIDILTANTECRYSGYVEWDALEDIRLGRLFFEIKEKTEAKYPDLKDRIKIVGWFHTHPNQLPVWMSETDMKTQHIKYFNPDKYSVVINPQRGIIRAFAGKDAVEVPFVLLSGKCKMIDTNESSDDSKKRGKKKNKGKNGRKKTYYPKKRRK